MPLTPQQLQEMDKIAGVKTPTPVNEFAQLGRNRAEQIQAIAKTARATERKATRTIPEKIADFTGGKELAQGLGQAIASKKTSKDIEEVQQSQFDLSSRVLQRIKEKKAAGEDVTKLENALKTLQQDINIFAAGSERMLNPNELTEKQVVGDALQLGTTLATVGTLPGVVKKAGAVGVGKGIIQGAKAGAISGGTFGTATGASQGLQKDKDAKGIVKEAITGGITGAIGGGLVGGAIGGVSGGIKAAKIGKGKEHLSAVTPNTKDLSPEEYRLLVRKGKISPKTSTSPDKYILSNEEIAIADKYKKLLGKDPVENTHNLIREIEKKDIEVGKFLDKKNGIFNTGELKNNLTKKLANIDDLTIDEKRLAKLKKSTIDNFVKSLKKNDMKSLWKARKEFDQKIESAFSGSPTLQKEIKKEFRNAVQDFISERTDDVTYKGYMKEMRELFNLADITDTKAVKEKGMNAIQLWIKHNPTKAKTIAWGAGTGVVGTVGASLLKD